MRTWWGCWKWDSWKWKVLPEAGPQDCSLTGWSLLSLQSIGSSSVRIPTSYHLQLWFLIPVSSNPLYCLSLQFSGEQSQISARAEFAPPCHAFSSHTLGRHSSAELHAGPKEGLTVHLLETFIYQNYSCSFPGLIFPQFNFSRRMLCWAVGQTEGSCSKSSCFLLLSSSSSFTFECSFELFAFEPALLQFGKFTEIPV